MNKKAVLKKYVLKARLNDVRVWMFLISAGRLLHSFGAADWKTRSPSVGRHHMGYLPFTRENRKFQLENQMVRAIPFGKLQKIWAVILGDAIFLLFQVSLADVDIFYSDSYSRNLAFNCFMFMPEISNRMVFVNGKHPCVGWHQQNCIPGPKIISWLGSDSNKINQILWCEPIEEFEC